MGTIKKQVSMIIKNHREGLSISEIAARANVSRHTAALALAELKGEKKIRIRNVAAAKLHYWRDK